MAKELSVPAEINRIPLKPEISVGVVTKLVVATCPACPELFRPNPKTFP